MTYSAILTTVAAAKVALANVEAAVALMTPPLRGINLAGCEGGYGFSSLVADKGYAVHKNETIDYYYTSGVRVLRFLFSWERMQSMLGGPVPAYAEYFDHYKATVDYATSKGMTVILAPWQASTAGGAGGACYRGAPVTGGQFADFWSKMSGLFKSNPLVEINLINEPNNMNTVVWFSMAQSAITAIRAAGFAGRIHVPGNGWTGAHSWNSSWYDTAPTKVSNAYGWLKLSDPLNNLIVEVHTYADTDASGSSASVVSNTISRDRVKIVVDWARANNLKVFIGEIGMYAPNAQANWTDFIAYCDANRDIVKGFTWWAGGKPGWWDDPGGSHFSVTPTAAGDTTNMTMIKPSLLACL